MDTPTESGRSFAKQNEIKKRASSGDDNIWCRRDLQVGLAARRGEMAKSVVRSKTVRSDEALMRLQHVYAGRRTEELQEGKKRKDWIGKDLRTNLVTQHKRP
jgi:hypothetical protein